MTFPFLTNFTDIALLLLRLMVGLGEEAPDFLDYFKGYRFELAADTGRSF